MGRNAMKHCSYCGAEYPNDVTECPLDHQPLVEQHVAPFSAKPHHVTRIADRHKLLRRFLVIVVAFALGWLFYMVTVVRNGSEPLEFLFAPFIGLMCSALTLGLSLLLGLLFKIPVLGRWWKRIPTAALISLLAILAIVTCSATLETHTGGTAYLILVFTVANWPLKERRKPETVTPPDGGPAAPPVISEVPAGPPSVS